MQFCLFVWGSFALARLFICIALTTILERHSVIQSPPPTASQQPAIESVSLICLSSSDSEFPSEAAMTSQAAWETDWWQICSVLLLLAHFNSSNILSEH